MQRTFNAPGLIPSMSDSIAVLFLLQFSSPPYRFCLSLPTSLPHSSSGSALDCTLSQYYFAWETWSANKRMVGGGGIKGFLVELCVSAEREIFFTLQTGPHCAVISNVKRKQNNGESW